MFCVILNCVVVISSNLVQDYRQVVLGEDSEASTTIVAEKENNQQATTTTNKSITAISIADAETDD